MSERRIRERRHDPSTYTVAIAFLLVVVTVPIVYAYYEYRSFLQYFGLFMVVCIGLTVLGSLVAVFGLAFRAWRRPIEVLPVGRDGTYMVRGGKVIPLAPLSQPSRMIEEKPRIEAPRVNHIPVSIRYTHDMPPIDDELEDTTVLAPPDVDTVPNLNAGEEALYSSAMEAYLNGYTSRKKLAEYLGVSERKAAGLIMDIKKELGS